MACGGREDRGPPRYLLGGLTLSTMDWSAGNRRLWPLALITLVFVLLFLTLGAPSVMANYPGEAIEVEVTSTVPVEIEMGESFSISISIENVGDVDFTGIRKLTIRVLAEGDVLAEKKDINLLVNGSVDVQLPNIKIDSEGTHELKLEGSAGAEQPVIYSDGNRIGPVMVLGTVNVIYVEEPINWIPIIAIVAVVAVLGIGFVLFKRRKEQIEARQRIEDEARRKEMIRKKEAKIAKKIEVKQIVGKQPRDYYVLRRSKYAKLRPSGMTSSGLTILKYTKTEKEIEEERQHVCPKCGTDLESEGALCPRCSATEKVASVRHEIRSYKSRGIIDLSDAEALLRKAEHRLSWSDFNMANDLVEKASHKMEETWKAFSEGQTLEHSVVEYSEAEGPSLDAKLIGLEGEETAMPLSTEAVGEVMPAELEGAGEACTECGNTMYEGECYHCDFEKHLHECWAIIEEGETDGAPMDEVKDLCRQAHNAIERGSNELAVRYLGRSKRLAKETLESHTHSKTEGIIQFTEALIRQVKGMGEDVSMAEAMLKKAQAALEGGEHSNARSYAAKADGFLKQLRDDSCKKRIGELMPEVEEGATANAEVKTLLAKAKKLIDANELEGAVDLLEAAASKL